MTNTDPNRPPGEVHGASKVTPVPARKGLAWLPWLIGALLLLALLFLLLRGCNKEPAAVTTTNTTTTETTNTVATTPGTPPVAVETVTLPGGQKVDLEPNTLNYELQKFLGSPDPTPRTFTFDRLNFATDSAELPADADATVGALAQILAAYPKARVELAGYADSTGADPHNVELGAGRAQAVMEALIAKGVDAGRVKTATGGSSNPVDTNATAAGRAENRRTELVVTAK